MKHYFAVIKVEKSHVPALSPQPVQSLEAVPVSYESSMFWSHFLKFPSNLLVSLYTKGPNDYIITNYCLKRHFLVDTKTLLHLATEIENIERFFSPWDI